MTLKKITERDLQGYGVIGMADTPNLSAREMQEKVEEVVRRVVIPVMNENVDNAVSKQDLAYVAFNSGIGDMLTLNYDTNMDGIVNKADNGFFTYTHSKVGNVHYLKGSGNNVKFTATADFYDGDTFMIDDSANTAYLTNGELLPDRHFKKGYVVSCFRNGNSLNFNNGGAAFNFKIVGGTQQPASPAENTIWVNTDIKITEWALSATAPDYMEYGGVWIETASTGNTLMNTLKTNQLSVAPKKAWQWCGESVGFKEMYVLIYMNGQWVTPEEIVFPYGLDFETGGTNKDYCTVAETYLRCAASPTLTYGSCHSLTTLDCSKYTKLKFTVESVVLSGNATATVGVHSTGEASTSSGYTALQNVTAPGDYEVDITNVKHNLYVTMSCWSSTGTPEMTVTDIIAM